MATDTRKIGITFILSFAIVIGASVSARLYFDRQTAMADALEVTETNLSAVVK